MTGTRLAPQPEVRTGESERPLVVCVDDEMPVLASLSRLLRSEPYDFRITTDPEEALEWVRTGEVALLIADYRMPAMSGTTLLQLAKACSPRTRRMMLTGYTGESMVIAAGGTGLMDIVGKPWNDEALKRTIRDRLASEERTGPHSPFRDDE